MDLITDEIKRFVNKVKLGFVATVSPDGTPNLSPKGTTVAYDDEHLVFADIHSPGTINNLKHNPVIEINVVDIFTRKGYRFKGVAEVLSEGEKFQSILSYYGDIGSKYLIKNIVVIKVNVVSQIWSPAYDHTSNEEEITKHWIDYWRSIHNDTNSTKTP